MTVAPDTSNWTPEQLATYRSGFDFSSKGMGSKMEGQSFYTFDDGSTLTFDGAAWAATPIQATEIVQNGVGDTGFLSILDTFAGAATKVGSTISTLQSQAMNVENARARNELERYKTLAAVQIGKSGADVATINAQRDVAIAKAQLAGLSSAIGNPTMLVLLAAGAVALIAMR